MLDTIKSLFREGLEYSHTAGLLQQIVNIISILNAQHMKDANSKNAAIDAICAILQSHKDMPAPAISAAQADQTTSAKAA